MRAETVDQLGADRQPLWSAQGRVRMTGRRRPPRGSALAAFLAFPAPLAVLHPHRHPRGDHDPGNDVHGEDRPAQCVVEMAPGDQTENLEARSTEQERDHEGPSVPESSPPHVGHRKPEPSGRPT